MIAQEIDAYCKQIALSGYAHDFFYSYYQKDILAEQMKLI